MTDSAVLNIREAAAYLGAHEQTVRKLARRGAIPAFKVGRDWRFRRDALQQWTESQQVGGPRASALVVDDEAQVASAMARMLERLDCRTRHTTNAVDGLALVEEEPPDLILLDLMMPGMNGPQFLAHLRQAHPTLPVVIVTAYPDSDLMLEAMRYAPVMLLSKPLAPEALERTLTSILGDHGVAAQAAGAASAGAER